MKMWIIMNWLTVCSSGFYEQGAKPSGSTQAQHYINQLDYHELLKKDLALVSLYELHISGDYGGQYVWGDLESENYREQNSHPTNCSVHVLHTPLYKMYLLNDNWILRICGNKMPTRCNIGFYCRSYCLLNMFRAPLCPSSGAQE